MIAPPRTPRLVLVLVEPAGPLNIGSIARLGANFGIQELRLVAPRCDPLAEEARRMAIHGWPLLEAAKRCTSLSEALSDCKAVLASSGRREGHPQPPMSPEAALPWLARGAAASDAPAALVFGREDRGLSGAELLQAGRIVQIESSPMHPSLNLSHAAAVLLHGWFTLVHPGEEFQGLGMAPQVAETLCSHGALEATLADAEQLLLEVGFLLPHTARARMAKLRALLQRAGVQDRELALLRGMVRQLRWASQHPGPCRTP